MFKNILSWNLRLFIYNHFSVYFKTTSHKRYLKSGEHADKYAPLFLNPSKVIAEHHTRIQPGVHIYDFDGKVIIKKYSAVSANCTIIPGGHIPTVGMPQYLSDSHLNDKGSDIVIGEDCWVGTRAILMAHASLGRGCVVGAGAVVTKPVPPYAVVGGTPAKIIATRFSIEQILRHEEILYPEDERMSREQLEEIFKTHFEGKRHIGADEFEGEARRRFDEVMAARGVKEYDK